MHYPHSARSLLQHNESTATGLTVRESPTFGQSRVVPTCRNREKISNLENFKHPRWPSPRRCVCVCLRVSVFERRGHQLLRRLTATCLLNGTTTTDGKPHQHSCRRGRAIAPASCNRLLQEPQVCAQVRAPELFLHPRQPSHCGVVSLLCTRPILVGAEMGGDGASRLTSVGDG